MAAPFRCNENVYRDIAKKYSIGKSSKVLGDEYGFSGTHILRIVSRFGIKIRSQRELKLGKLNLKKRLFSLNEEKKIVKEYQSGKTLFQISKQRKTNQTQISRVLKRYKIQTRKRWETGKGGKYCSRWNGGVWYSPDGHRRVTTHTSDANKGNWKQEHRMIMEKHLGRKLEQWEVVHHKNGVPDDNRIRNLQVMSKRDHQKLHAAEQGLGTKIKGGRKWL